MNEIFARRTHNIGIVLNRCPKAKAIASTRIIATLSCLSCNVETDPVAATVIVCACDYAVEVALGLTSLEYDAS